VGFEGGEAVAISGRGEDDREVAARTRAGGGGIVAEWLKEEDEGCGDGRGGSSPFYRG
jgi:hypothetical protein